ncbi:hypothetical protein ABPG72_006173 [Tetrahymena utriculariae]
MVLQYTNNQIDAKISSQSFFAEEGTFVDLKQDLIAFQYEYTFNKYLDELESSTNKTYLVITPYFYYRNQSFQQFIKLSYKKCQDPELERFNCIDFSKISNYTLNMNQKKNIGSYILMYIHRCYDVDMQKPFVPENCASKAEVEQLISNTKAIFYFKLYTSQYNTTSKKLQVNYKSSYSYILGDQHQLFNYRIQQSTTTVKDGIIFQQKQDYYSPIQYSVNQQNFNWQTYYKKSNQTSLMQINFQMDEFIQYVKIQYQTFPEILAQINSIFSLLMLAGIIARKFASSLIFKEFKNLFLQNLYFSTNLKLNEHLKLNNSNQQGKCVQKKKKKNNQSHQESHFSRQANQKQEEVKLDLSQLNLYDNQVEQSLSNNQSQIKDFQQISLNNNNKNQEFQYQNQELTLNNSCQSYFPKNCVKKTPKKYQQNNLNDSLHQNYDLTQSENKNHQQSPSLNPQNQSNLTNLIPDQDQGQNIDQQFKYSLNLKLQRKNLEHKSCKFDKKIKKFIEKEVHKSLDVLQLYKDQIFLKKAIMILLRKDQLAAIEFIGICPQALNKRGDCNQDNQHEKKEKLNYFEKQFAISISNQLTKEYAQKFLDRVNLNQQSYLNEIDKRILSCLS